MRTADDRATPSAGTWRRLLRRGLGAAALLLLLAACQGTPPTGAPLEGAGDEQEMALAAVNLPVNEALRARFLPPLGRANPSGAFVSGLGLEIVVFNVDPATGVASAPALGPTLSTAAGDITRVGDTYRVTWSAQSVTLDPAATDYLRLEIRAAGAAGGPACNSAAEPCLGYLDVYAFDGSGNGWQAAPAGFVPVAALGGLPVSFKLLESDLGPPPATLGELTALSGEKFDESVGNCASSYLTRPSQGLQAVGAGLQAVGAVGGLFQGATADFTATLKDPSVVGEELLGELLAYGSDKNVVLFVVDDFSNGVELPQALFEADPDLAALAGQVSHGALVLHHLRQVAPSLLQSSYWRSGTGPDGQPYYYLKDASGNKLFVQVVDVGEFDTDDIPDKIRAAMRAYLDADHGKQARSMVVNMSFAIVPCTVLDDFEAVAELETFEEYLVALAAQNDVGLQYLPELDQLVSLPVAVTDDPLLAFTACPLPSADGARCDGGTSGTYGTSGWHGVIKNLHQVAAAGNYGNGYALYPAASEFVISVGSLEAVGTGYGVADYSNRAEIAAPGGLFELASAGGSTVAYAGTSFAAPVVSLFLAVDGMRGAPRCPVVDVNERQPPALAYGTNGMEPFYAPGDDALSAYCQNAS